MKAGTIRTALITGGAGFVGSNLAERLLSEPDVRVRVLDNLSRRVCAAQSRLVCSRCRPGIAWRWSTAMFAMRPQSARRSRVLPRSITSLHRWRSQHRLRIRHRISRPNALGTFNVLEAARTSGCHPFLLYTSTNKVYGSLENVPVEVEASHYKARKPGFQGVDENEQLDFHSPYGCSKGAADQYVRDYARIYGLPTVVFRMSCIAGPRQFGNEDQGWVAHFLYSVLSGHPITIYGDGYQVRDVLHVYDLIDAMLAARSSIQCSRGEIYNLGGGMKRVISVVELLRKIEKSTAMPLNLEYRGARPGDQPLYISDTSKLERHTGWQPSRSLDRILDDIHSFWQNNRGVIRLKLLLVPCRDA